MNILGQGLQGIVVASADGSVKKFYRSKKEWEQEKANLEFLAAIQKQGFDIECKIPEVIGPAIEGKWKINDKTYGYCNKMGLIPGVPANISFATKDLEVLGNNLGTVLFAMHTQSKKYIPQWASNSDKKDSLLTHILKDKVERVISEEADESVKRCVKKAANYLRDREALLISRRALSHLDLNLTNVLVSKQNRIEGLVDWGSFELGNPTLSLYQLATTPTLWTHVKKQYEEQGGTIMDDVLYAAATIHLAWAPLKLKEFGKLGLELGKDATRERFEEMYAEFARAAGKL